MSEHARLNAAGAAPEMASRQDDGRDEPSSRAEEKPLASVAKTGTVWHQVSPDLGKTKAMQSLDGTVRTGLSRPVGLALRATWIGSSRRHNQRPAGTDLAW